MDLLGLSVLCSASPIANKKRDGKLIAISDDLESKGAGGVLIFTNKNKTLLL